MTESTHEAEAYIRYRLSTLASSNEHHRFEEIATRIARKRISANILVATGPVSSGGDQGRDAESYMTRIPDELPHAAGFSASASTEPVVIACTVQRTGLKGKILADVNSICAAGADPVAHVAYFSVHPISAGVTHDLKKIVRDKHGVSLDIFSDADLATLLAEPDLVWVARQYLDLPSSMVPLQEDDPAPRWYAELIHKLRQNGGPAVLTPATQGEVTQGLRYATWDRDTNAELPEWLDFMAVFLTDSRDGKDTDLVFRACYEIAIARFRGTGSAGGVEELVRRALAFANSSDHPNIIDDAVTLASYWGVIWVSGVGRADTQEMSQSLLQLRDHAIDLLAATNVVTHPVRAASLTGTLAFLYLLPDWCAVEQTRGRPQRVDVAAGAGVRLDEAKVDLSGLSECDLLDAAAAMSHLESLIDLLPHARAYSISPLARVFNLMAPVLADHPSYRKIRDGLDTTIAEAEGDAAVATRCRDRGTAFVKAGKPLLALAEMHEAKIKWFNGETLYGAVLTMRFIAKLYADLRLNYAAKMYACAAAAVAAAHGDDDLKEQLPKALLEAAIYVQQAGCWADGAGLSDIALLARAHHLAEPFDLEEDSDLLAHHTNSVLELSLVRKLWSDLEPLIAETYSHNSEWFADLSETVELVGGNPMSEEDFVGAASKDLTGPIFGDLGPERVVDFAALGVRWSFSFANDRVTVLSSESLIAAFQIFLADVATFDPVIFSGIVHVTMEVPRGAEAGVNNVTINRSAPTPTASVILSLNDLAPHAQLRVLVATSIQLLSAVIARPPAELQALIEPMFKKGLMHKLFAGRPYEEVAGYLDDAHYARCASAQRPQVASLFSPIASPSLLASTTIGAGYDSNLALQLIRERYEVAENALRYTLPRLLADPVAKQTIVEMREAGWLDWQILVSLVNASMNWRMQQAGVRPGIGDPEAGLRLAREPETAESPKMPLEIFSTSALSMHVHMQTLTSAARWDLRSNSKSVESGAMRELLIRRYRYVEDDVPHLDLLNEAVADGILQPLLKDSD